MEASKLFSLFQIPYHSWISLATMFAYKLNTPLPMLEKMYMYDIILEYKELEKIMKQENGEGNENDMYTKQMDEYKGNIDSQMSSYKSNMSNSLPKLPNTMNMSSLTSGFKMPKL